MVTVAEKCSVCGNGTLRPKRVHEELFGIDLGTYQGMVCDNCEECFLDGRTMDRMESRAKELGLWGLASRVRIARSGNSPVIRVPASLAKYLNMKKGQEVFLSPEKKRRLGLERV